MDGLLIQPKPNAAGGLANAALKANQNSNVDALIIRDLATPKDKSPNTYDRILDSFAFTAQKVLEKLNTIFTEAGIPDIKTLQPAEYTPEKTADRLVAQIGALFSAYQKQNSDKEPEEILAGFMKLARSGVEQGYSEAYGILEDIGAFDLPGIREGTEETRKFIDQKLNAFEEYLAEKLGIRKADEVTATDFEAPVTQNLLAQGGAQIDVTV